MKVLIIEDEFAISELIRMSLSRAGYVCDTCYDGEVALRKIEEHSYDLLLLDIMLPKITGYEILSYIETQNLPVICITAKSSIQDRVKGLHLGADDYLIKPFSLDELLARVESVLRRYHKREGVFMIQGVLIDPSSRKVTRDDILIELTNQEYELLVYLIRNKNIALYRDTLYQNLWKDEIEHSRTLDLHIQRLRKKLQWQDVIKTVYRIGYMLEDR